MNEYRIGIITIHVGSNFGSVLQTVATSNILQQLGYNTEVINYIPERMTLTGFIKKRTGFFAKAKAILGLPIMYINKQIYGGFIKKHTNLTKPYYSSTIFKIEKKYQTILIGSDQVWNSEHNDGIDNAYYLNFLPKGIKKVAFSSSFGRESISSEEENLIKKYLSDFSHISTRESSGVEILYKMGITKAIQTLDPTMLLTKEEWHQYMSKRIINEPYILVYLPYNIINKDQIYTYVRELSNQYRLKIISFGWDIRKDPYANHTINFATPSDFLNLINYADFVVTNSFHGTVFSIILNKQFQVFCPSKYSTRILEILNLTELNNHIVSPEHFSTEDYTSIDYYKVNQIISKERNKAINYLKEALS